MSGLNDTIKALHAEVATLLHQKKTDEEILSFIVSKGYEEHYAGLILENVKNDDSDKKNFWKTLFYGIGFLVSGVILTLASRYFGYSKGAAFYLFFWGLIVAGISIIAKAFIIFRK